MRTEIARPRIPIAIRRIGRSRRNLTTYGAGADPLGGSLVTARPSAY
jgi:hypothetical protein